MHTCVYTYLYARACMPLRCLPVHMLQDPGVVLLGTLDLVDTRVRLEPEIPIRVYVGCTGSACSPSEEATEAVGLPASPSEEPCKVTCSLHLSPLCLAQPLRASVLTRRKAPPIQSSTIHSCIQQRPCPSMSGSIGNKADPVPPLRAQCLVGGQSQAPKETHVLT